MRCRILLCTVALAALGALSGPAQTWTRDASFNPVLRYEIADLLNTTLVAAPDNRVLLYGTFTALKDGAFQSRGLAYLRADGSVDQSFVSSVGPEESIAAAAPLPGGAVIAYRRNASYAGAIVRYLADGRLDPAFAPIDCPYQVNFVPLPDGRCIVWGDTLKLNGTFFNCVERLTTAGRIDPAFNAVSTRGLADILALAVATDGSLFVSSTVGSVEHGATPTPVVRLNADGTLDPRFTGPTPPKYNIVMAAQQDGKLLVGTTNGLSRHNTDGTLDPGFAAAIPDLRGVSRLAVTPAGIVVDALVGTGDGPWPHAVFLLSSSGAVLRDLRDLFAIDHTVQLETTQSDGSLFVTHGLRQAINDPPPPGVIEFAYFPPEVIPADPALVRIPADAASAIVADAGIQRVQPGSLSYLHVQPDSAVVVSGGFTSANGAPRAHVARFTPGGALDATFVPAPEASKLSSIQLFAPDGGVLGWAYVLGDKGADGNYRLNQRQFVRLRGDGSLDTEFAPNSDYAGPEIRWLAIAADGRVLVSRFVPDSSQEQNLRLEWLAANGRLQTVLPTRFSGLPRATVSAPGSTTGTAGFPNPFRFVQLLADGRLLVGGTFKNVNNADAPWLVRLNADGSVDSTYAPDLRDASDTVMPYAADAGGRALFAGQTTQSGQPVWLRFRLLANGQRDPTYGYDGPPLHFAEMLTGENGLPDLNFPPAGTITRPGDSVYGQRAPDGTVWSTEPFARFTAADVAAITIPPADQAVTAGFDAVFVVGIGTRHAATYQWLRNDTPIAGATHSYLPLFAVTADHAGAYRVRVMVDGQTLTSPPAQLTVRGGTARVVNFSGRANVGMAPMIAGFAISDGTPRSWLLRATGPSLSLLAAFGLDASLPDPDLGLFHGGRELAHDRGGILASDVTDFARKVGAFPPYVAPGWFPEWRTKESALVPTLPSGSYTAHVTSASGAEGIALFELYDAYPEGASGAVNNLSLRARTSAGSGIPTLGFVVAGDTTVKLLVRGLGPALRGFGVTAALADPQLAVYRGSGRDPLARNSGWASDAAVAEAARTVGAFPLATGSADAALVLRLEPGAYTVQLSSISGTAGEGLVEVYVIGSP